MTSKRVISQFLATSALALSLPLGVVQAAESGPYESGHGVHASPSDQEFKRADSNGDGFLVRAETARYRHYGAAFRAGDENKDGKLSREEFARAQSVYERQRAAIWVDDSLITARVKAALVLQEGLEGMAVSVETHGGVVLLSGFVEDEAQVRTAIGAASKVAGVQAVESKLLIKS